MSPTAPPRSQTNTTGVRSLFDELDHNHCCLHYGLVPSLDRLLPERLALQLSLSLLYRFCKGSITFADLMLLNREEMHCVHRPLESPVADGRGRGFDLKEYLEGRDQDLSCNRLQSETPHQSDHDTELNCRATYQITHLSIHGDGQNSLFYWP
jgi:hypothetical protein